MSQLERLGLLDNPFNNNIEARYFYADESRNEILKSSEQLIDHSNDFQVIVGDPGMGKSHFLEALSERIDDNFRVVKVIDAMDYDTDSLLQGLLDTLGTKDFDNDIELLEVLETQLAEINTFGFKPILFVDNAQALSLESLCFLVQLSQQKNNEKSYINIVLFGTTEITELLQDQELKEYRDIIHLATLISLDKNDLPAYLKHKMLASGFEREIPFTDRIIDSIFTDSKGVPKEIDFYANKFLASSGKADNYIEKTEEKNKENKENKQKHIDLITEDQVDDFEQLKDNEFLDSLDELAVHPSDRAEEQLNRLNEEFDEIEQINSKSNDSSVTEYSDEKDDLQQIFDDNQALSESALPKFVIPMALIGILVVAAIVISSIFKSSEQEDNLAGEEEEIAELVLELPPQDVNSHTMENERDETIKHIETSSDTLIDLITTSQDVNNTETVDTEMGDAEVVDVEVVTETPIDNSQQQTSSAVASESISADTLLSIPELKSVDPKVVIGSNHRQYITIQGNNLKKQTRIFVNWLDGKKEFSQEKTPRQWQYINKNKIKLHLNTGISIQKWQVFAKNREGQSSKVLNFNVVEPYVAKISIKEILPSSFVGSNNRQNIMIKGEGFSQKTIIELRWDKNKKRFSSQLTPEQFKYINVQQINLSIATGINPKKWMVIAISPTGNTSRSSFSVVKNQGMDRNRVTQTSPVKNAQNKAAQRSMVKGENWLKQQADDNYTIQLLGSHNKQAINHAIQEYTLTSNVLIYKTLRDGRDWYTITYGSYASKQLAEMAVKHLGAQLIRTPWVRSFASIKKQLSIASLTPKNKQVSSEAVISGQNSPNTDSETWVRTQDSKNYTIQLIALSSEESINRYRQKYAIESQSAYFKAMLNGKLLYVLISGSYKDKQSAQQAGDQLFQHIKEGKPWVRQFSTLQGIMVQ